MNLDDDEPLELCPDSGFEELVGAVRRGGHRLSRRDIDEVATISLALQEELGEGSLELAFVLWVAGRIFEQEIKTVALKHRLL